MVKIKEGGKMANKSPKEYTSQELFQIFTHNVPIHKKPIVVITMGIPGSGKSTIVKKFIQKNMNNILPKEEGEYKLNEFINCNPDEILPYLPSIKNDKEMLAMASRKNGAIIKKLREGENKFSVIYDGTGVNFSSYKGNIGKFIENGYFTILLYVKTNPLVAKNRIRRRTRKVKSKDVDRIFYNR